MQRRSMNWRCFHGLTIYLPFAVVWPMFSRNFQRISLAGPDKRAMFAFVGLLTIMCNTS